MTEQPIEPRERDGEQNPETSSPTPEGDPAPEPEEGAERCADAQYVEALSGVNVGSDTRAGSLRGGSASGSERDPDQVRIDAALASEGMDAPEPRSFADGETGTGAGQAEVVNTGQSGPGANGDPAEGRRDPTAGDDADAATG